MTNHSFTVAEQRSQRLLEDLVTNPHHHRVLTGDRPTGPLHIGHEFGSIANRVLLQNLGVESFIVIADYQVLTDRRDVADIPNNIANLVLDYLSLGLDPFNHRTFIFTHSQIPELHQLVIPFSMVVTVSELKRNPTIKDEIQASGIRSPSVGMFTYPISQAADILFCKSTVVPVGKDQLPHLELTRKIAARCNEWFDESIFPEPTALLSTSPLLLGLDGRQKMSKSRDNAIFLTMSADEVEAAIKKAKTDSDREIVNDPVSRPEVSNLLLLFSLCSGIQIGEVEAKFRSKGYSELKRCLTDVVNSHLEPIRARRAQFAKTKGIVNEVLTKGTREARQRAEETLEDVRRAMRMSMQYFEL
jgi:tryptophanyl-tRNA synthetase